MRVFVTGASGWIGSAITAELLAAGHQVVGLARSDESAAAIASAGVEVQRGDLTDLASLRAGAEGADGIIHTAFIHDFAAHEAAAAVDLAAVQLFGDLLEGTDRPLVIASGMLGAGSRETDLPDSTSIQSPRQLTEKSCAGFCESRYSISSGALGSYRSWRRRLWVLADGDQGESGKR